MECAKSWYLSKTIWTSIIVVIITSYNAISANFGTPPIHDVVYALLGALGIYSRVVADKVIE